MKINYTILLVCALTCLLVACGKSQVLNSPEDPTSAATSESEVEQFVISPSASELISSEVEVSSTQSAEDEVFRLDFQNRGYAYFKVPDAEVGKTYTWTVYLRASEPGTISVASWDGTFARQLVELKTDWKEVSVVASPNDTKLRFYIDVRMRGVTLSEVEVRFGRVAVD